MFIETASPAKPSPVGAALLRSENRLRIVQTLVGNLTNTPIIIDLIVRINKFEKLSKPFRHG